MSELVAPDLPNEWANIDDSSVSFEDTNTIGIIFEYKFYLIKQPQNIQVALLVGGNLSQDSGVKYQANSPIYKSPVPETSVHLKQTGVDQSDHQSNEETFRVSFKSRLNFS